MRSDFQNKTRNTKFLYKKKEKKHNKSEESLIFIAPVVD